MNIHNLTDRHKQFTYLRQLLEYNLLKICIPKLNSLKIQYFYFSTELHATIYSTGLSFFQVQNMWNEEVILRDCIQNDRKAQKLLYEKYAPVLLGICIRFTRNRNEAEDILQESFVKIFLNLKSFQKKSSLMGWMRKIVINTAITMYHRNLKHQHHYNVEDLRERNMSGSENEDFEFTREELLNVIQDLPPGYRMVFNLYAIEGYKHKEIAKKLLIDINTSKSQYSRAKRLIQFKLGKLKKEARKQDG